MVSVKPTMATGHEGCLDLSIERVAGESTIVRARATSPLKLLTPRPRGASAWAYVSSYGGGMVKGDRHRLEVEVGPGAAGFFGTQSSTKVYRTPDGQACEQRARVTLGSGAFFAWVPDPVQPFEGAVYRQYQEFHLQPDSNLAFVDSFTAGRSERGEHWAFSEYRSRTEIWVAQNRRLLDSTFLRSDDHAVSVNQRMGATQAMAVMVLLGPKLGSEIADLLARIARQTLGGQNAVRVSASPVEAGAIVRIAASRVEAVRQQIAELLSFLPQRLGDDPFARKW